MNRDEALQEDLAIVNRMADAGKTQVEMAETMGITRNKVRRLLITAGRLDSPTIRRVADLMAEGKSDEEIAAELGILSGSVMQHKPYNSGEYKYKAVGLNAPTRLTASSQGASTVAIPEAMQERAEELGLAPDLLAAAVLEDWVRRSRST